MERGSSLGATPILARADNMMQGVLPLAAAFDRFDGDRSGGIDVTELRAALEFLGVAVSSDQATNILRHYDDYPDQTLDVKEAGDSPAHHSHEDASEHGRLRLTAPFCMHSLPTSCATSRS